MVLNINYGKNQEIMKKCLWLHGYAFLIHKIRAYERTCKDRSEAVGRAIDECIRKGVLETLLRRHRGEVMHSVLREYDEQRHIANEKQWSYEEGEKYGRELGEKLGEKQGIDKGIQILIRDNLEQNISEENIIEKLNKYYYLDDSQAAEYIRKVKDL